MCGRYQLAHNQACQPLHANLQWRKSVIISKEVSPLPSPHKVNILTSLQSALTYIILSCHLKHYQPDSRTSEI